MSVSPTNETTRRGNRVLHSRLPVSLRHCPVYLPRLLAVIASGIGHSHTARASSRLTSHGCTSCKKSRKHHGPIACWTPRRALIGTRFPTSYDFYDLTRDSPNVKTKQSCCAYKGKPGGTALRTPNAEPPRRGPILPPRRAFYRRRWRSAATPVSPSTQRSAMLGCFPVVELCA